MRYPTLVATIALVSAGFIEAPLSVSRPNNLFKRDAHGTPLANNIFCYTTDIGIGNPSQPISVVLDTGSSDLWVMKSSNPYCQLSNSTCVDKVFNPEKSSTFEYTDDPFAIRYGDFSYALGEWGQDMIEIAGITIKNTSFALANESNSTQIVMGVGLPSLESTITGVNSEGFEDGTYNNIPQLFKQQGYIDTVVYSLWLNDADAQSGNILFGGIDDTKFTGPLNLVPMINLSHKLKDPYSFHIMINGISIQSDAGEEQVAALTYPALLDSGTSFAYLPTELVEALAYNIGYKWNSVAGYFTGNCKIPNNTVNFDFSGVKIPVPYSSLVMPYSISQPDLCALVILPSRSEYSTILGDVFLRNIYAVFDLDNYEIGIAPAKSKVNTSNIQVVKEGIPGVRAPLYDKTTPISNITLLGSSSHLQKSKHSADSLGTKDSTKKSTKNSAGRLGPTIFNIGFIILNLLFS